MTRSILPGSTLPRKISGRMNLFRYTFVHLLPGLLLITAVCLATACEDNRAHRMVTEDQVFWPYWPIGMRVHPLTRFVEDRESSLYILEARIEFTDQDEDITKACGELSLRLFELQPTGTSGEVLQEWFVDLRDLDRNHQHFDDVTSTYLFRLQVDRELLQERMELHTRYVSADGRSFDASYLIER